MKRLYNHLHSRFFTQEQIVEWYDKRSNEWIKAKILTIHRDAPPELYFTLLLECGRTPQTTIDRIRRL